MVDLAGGIGPRERRASTVVASLARWPSAPLGRRTTALLAGLLAALIALSFWLY